MTRIIAETIRGWFAHIQAKSRARKIARIEQARSATMRAAALRRDKHAASSPKMAELYQQTCQSLAASCGRDWKGV